MMPCVKCDHHKLIGEKHYCYFRVKESEAFDLVTGEELENKTVGEREDCYDFRSDNDYGKCGPDAQFFQSPPTIRAPS